MHRQPALLRAFAAAVAVLVLAGCGRDSGGTRAGAEPSAAEQLEAEIAALEQRATRLADIAAIERLQRAYGYYVDRADWDAVLGLLTDDATLEYGRRGVYAGKDSIRELLYALGGGEAGLELGELNEHIQLQPVIDVADDGRTAEGRWRLLGILGRYEEYARWQAGPFENTFRKTDGRWKISAIQWAESFTVPFDAGLTASVPADAEPAVELPPPNGPTTFEAERWPGVSLLPLHFEHPVNAGRAAEEAP